MEQSVEDIVDSFDIMGGTEKSKSDMKPDILQALGVPWEDFAASWDLVMLSPHEEKDVEKFLLCLRYPNNPGFGLSYHRAIIQPAEYSEKDIRTSLWWLMFIQEIPRFRGLRLQSSKDRSRSYCAMECGNTFIVTPSSLEGRMKYKMLAEIVDNSGEKGSGLRWDVSFETKTEEDICWEIWHGPGDLRVSRDLIGSQSQRLRVRHLF
ncbi:hypothetical protein BDN72DRAFT_843362 [Pluteus cervinus]|uniref:Uncharacterized protein n=1 Tax=Pluteus cervinus TaxID=181527 RepID=A0ACD3APJ4_9AGAR|nr:hypothetical protein BDN72DRAFT_843362 [Pluteus cervinus]